MDLNAGEEYERRGAAAEGEYARSQNRSGSYGQAALALGAGLFYVVYHALHKGGTLWPAAVLLLALIVCSVLLLRARKQANRAMRLVLLYDAGGDRAAGRKTQTGHTGEAFAEAGHVYARDLDVVGENSLFGMLATTRTALGQGALAGFLLRGVRAEQAQRRQAAVQELAPAFDLREQVALLGHSAYEELPSDSFHRWLASETSSFPGWLRPALVCATVAWLIVLIAGLLLHADQAVLLRNVLAMLALQGALCLRFRPAVQAELELAERLAGHAGILRNGLALLRGSRFASEQLRELQASAEGDDHALAELQRLLALVEQRAKEWYYVPALLLAVGTHAAAGLQRWKRAHAEPMRRWLNAWGEFDALLALSAYAAEHPKHVYPQLLTPSSGCAVFAATGLQHPLLPHDEAVANDILLDANARFLLISGSNMAGKSTLLRAIGANAVLALAGLPVPAHTLSLCAVSLGASLAVGDSLAERKSKFLAEVERLRAIVTLAQETRGRGLFLVDEILSGTNSLDRKVAAEAVLRSLVEAGAVGALSTHDLTLTALAEAPELHGQNVHMASAREDDPLAFDYLLKPGVNRTTNALAIVRMLGLSQ